MSGRKPVLTVRAHLLGRYNLQENETFSIEKAHGLVTMHRPKRDYTKMKTKMKVYQDCLRIARGNLFVDIPPPLLYPYENVVRFFVFKADPRVLALGVTEKGRKVFVLFRFKSLVHNNRVCDEIERTKGPGVAGGYTAPSDNTVLVGGEMKETMVVENFYADPVVRYEESAPPVRNGEVEPEVTVFVAPPVESSVVVVNRLDQQSSPPNGDVKYIDCEIIDDTEQLRPKKVKKERSSPVVLRTNRLEPSDKSLWEEDIKYITYNPRVGSVVSDTGPIYMYTAHQITPEYRGYSMCVSSSDDDNTSNSSSSDDEGMTARMSMNGPGEGLYDMPGPSGSGGGDYVYAVGGDSGEGTSYGVGGDTSYGVGGDTSYGVGGDTSYGVGGDSSYGIGGGGSYGVSGGASLGVTNPGFKIDY